MARYLVENDTGDVDQDICIPEMAAGRCPFHSLAFGDDRDTDICVECLIQQFSKEIQ